jgi:hypothetical protein
MFSPLDTTNAQRHSKTATLLALFIANVITAVIGIPRGCRIVTQNRPLNKFAQQFISSISAQRFK